jgi:hypothetical protein
MFRIEIFCDDRKLVDVLRGIAGLAIGNPKIQPVVNAEKKKNGKIEAALPNGKIEEMLHANITNNKLSTIDASYVKGFLKSIGKAPTSYSYCINQAIKTGWLKKTGKGSGMKYLVKEIS